MPSSALWTPLSRRLARTRSETARCGSCQWRASCESARVNGAPTPSEPPERGALLADATLTGWALCRALTEAADRWLAALLPDDVAGVALVAVGGYGRGEPPAPAAGPPASS